MKWLVYEWRQLRSFLLAYGGVWIILFVIASFYFMQPQYRSDHADGADAIVIPLLVMLLLHAAAMLLWRSLYAGKLAKRRSLIVAGKHQIVLWKMSLILVNSVIILIVTLLLTHMILYLCGHEQGLLSNFADRKFPVWLVEQFVHVSIAVMVLQLLFVYLKEFTAVHRETIMITAEAVCLILIFGGMNLFASHAIALILFGCVLLLLLGMFFYQFHKEG
ncbi:hypothetical protein [Massilicoli timonensis]|uniref:hypothetical protein n=1 Tax=Massilicoli timonensis TaxID=2015901 RepID=UPI000C822D19|nr:hypothetical protein [Massilicoli timonensis]